MKIDDVPVDAVGVANRVAWLAKRSIKTTAKAEGLRLALSMIDLTTLEGKDSDGKVRRLCAKALVPDPSDPTLPRCAAVCVYPPFVRLAKELTRGSGVRVASVATAFPSGQAPLATRLAEVRRRSADGADEIDMVIDRGAFLSGQLDEVADEIEQVKAACGDAHLKVILETGELETLDNVRHASLLAMRHGADFIKTSTGKVAPGGHARGDPRDARGDPRLRRGDRPDGRHEAGRRHPRRQGGADDARDREGDARRRVADAGVVPARRLVARERPADAAAEAAHRGLRVS